MMQKLIHTAALVMTPLPIISALCKEHGISAACLYVDALDGIAFRLL